MGRNCGYLALSAGLASEADWILIPENPPDAKWEDTLCKRLIYHREAGHRLNIVLVAEGAIDKEGNRISSEYVRNVIDCLSLSFSCMQRFCSFLKRLHRSR